MPKIRRYHPISHDFNRDPQIVALRKDLGDWAALAWQELLSIADRNDGIVPGTLDQIASRLAPVSLQMYHRRAQNAARTMLERFTDNSWITVRSDCIEIVKFWEYHRRPERQPLPPNHPNHPKTLKKESYSSPTEPAEPGSSEQLSLKDFVDSWNRSFQGKLSQVTWPLSEARKRKLAARLNEHRHHEDQFWTDVFTNINTSAFLLGNGNGTWKCTLDFLIANDTNPVKIFEGAYNYAKTNRA